MEGLGDWRFRSGADHLDTLLSVGSKLADGRPVSWSFRTRRNPVESASPRRRKGLIGSSGFVFFLKVRHDQLFSHFGRTHASVQYAIGNPLIAKDVSDKAPAICLYTPLRLAVYESPETHETIVSYDSPASLFGSFGVPEAAEIGAKLEGKLQDLLTRCL